jgi:hypothetical protein
VSRIALTLTVPVLLAGCAAPVALYEGPPRPDEEVALLSAAGHATVLQIDGRNMDTMEQLFALEPGTHLILFRARRTHLEFGNRKGSTEMGTANPQYTTHCFVTLEMEAGHRYALVSGLRSATRGVRSSPYATQHHATVVAGVRDEATGELAPGVKCDAPTSPDLS